MLGNAWAAIKPSPKMHRDGCSLYLSYEGHNDTESYFIEKECHCIIKDKSIYIL